MATGPRRIGIPAGTPKDRCKDKECRAPIYFAKHPTHGKLHPVSIAPGYIETTREPTATEDGVGFSHFVDCPAAHRFHGTKPPQKKAPVPPPAMPIPVQGSLF